MKARFLEAEEVEKLRESAGAEWLPLAVTLESGMRVGDVAKIKPGDLTPNGIWYTAEKTGKRGFAVVSPALIEALRAGANGEWCFPSPRKHGAHLTRQAIWARVKRAAERAGVDRAGTSPHALRKTFAVEKLQADGMEAVREALQHTRRETTEIYALSDWTSGRNAALPVLRQDLPTIVEKLTEILKKEEKNGDERQSNFEDPFKPCSRLFRRTRHCGKRGRPAGDYRQTYCRRRSRRHGEMRRKRRNQRKDNFCGLSEKALTDARRCGKLWVKGVSYGR